MPLLRKQVEDKNTKKKEKVLQFGIIEYDSTYNLVLTVFSWLGVRLTQKDPPARKFLFKVVFLFIYLNMYLGISLLILNVIQTVSTGTFIDLFTMMPVLLYSLVSMTKFTKIFFWRPVFENLVTELREIWPQNVITEDEYEVVKMGMNRLKYILKGTFYSNTFMLLFFIYVPFLDAVKRLFGQDIPYRLSFSYWLPFDPLQPGYYPVILISQSWHASINVLAMLSADMLLFVYISHITIQFELLAIKINKMINVPTDHQLIESYPLAKNTTENVTTMPKETLSVKDWDIRHQKQIINICKKHQVLIRLSGDLEGVHSFSLLVNFLSGSIIICFCGFCCVFVEKWNEVKFKTLLIAISLQLWVVCWFGQKLQDSSTEIAVAVYNSGWYNVSKKIKSSLIILLYRAQTEISLTTYGFSVISVASYSTIIKTSWSYLMLLISVFEE